jgi:hypothetical protein
MGGREFELPPHQTQRPGHLILQNMRPSRIRRRL